jgi:hypothetical protein
MLGLFSSTNRNPNLDRRVAKYKNSDEFEVAKVYAFRNQPDEAFDWLDRAYAKQNDGLILVKVDPSLRNLRSDPRYAALLKKLNPPI